MPDRIKHHLIIFDRLFRIGLGVPFALIGWSFDAIGGLFWSIANFIVDPADLDPLFDDN